MRKYFYLIVIIFLLGGTAYAVNPDQGVNRANAQAYAYIDAIYSQLNYERGMSKMKVETFRSAYYGYLNLLEHGKLSNKRYLTVCDFSLSSNTNRLWVIDVLKKKVVINTLVAHGSATGEEYATHFSNTPESHQSSLGFYVTKQTYSGGHGYSMRLNGVDGNFNNNADSRDVVMHGAEYVSRDFARTHKRIGRSWGCPAVESRMAAPIIDKIKNGSCLFIYHPTQSYLRSSFWLNNRIGKLPDAAQYASDNDDEVENVLSSEVLETENATEPANNAVLKDNVLFTVTKYEEPIEIQKLKDDETLNIQIISIPENEVTPQMRAKALKGKKTVHKITNVIHVSAKSDSTIIE